MASTNIFDTRHIIKQTPKLGNRFLLTADSTQLNNIINGKSGDTSPFFEKQPKLRKLNKFAGGNDDVIYTNNPTQILNLSLASCTVPAFEFETGDVNRFNDTIKHITKFSTINDMSSTFYDYINGSATAIMLAWQSVVGFKLTGEINYKSKYVCDMNLYVYGPNRPGYKMSTNTDSADSAEKDLIMQFKIFNAYPRSIDIGDFSYDNAEIKKITVQFGYDMIVPVKNNTRTSRGFVSNNSSYNDALSVSDKNAMAASTDIGGNADQLYGVFVDTKQTRGTVSDAVATPAAPATPNTNA